MHKLLTAFSQSSLIHIKGNYDKQTFNEVYMMYTSTSPNYAIVSSTEIAAAIVNGNWGKRLISNSIENALHFRREIQHLQKIFNSWFFNVWQPDQINEANCWPIQAGKENWHGFTHTDYDHVYLDPIKVTVLTPGLSKQGKMNEKGIPASLVAMFLEQQGIIVEKIGPYNILVLFSIGVDKTKGMTIFRGLIEFKKAYDSNLYIKNMLPTLYAKNPIFYNDMRIQTLAQNIHQLIVQYDFPNIMLKTINILPEMKMTPYMAFQHQVRGQVKVVELSELIGNISANMIIPYPPGVPVIMPGEMVTEKSKAFLDFILMFCAIGKRYPRFEIDIHGITLTKDKRYLVRILR